MSPEQIVLQLGIAGLIVWVGYKIAMKWLDRWSESEREKNASIAEGFKSITTSVGNHSIADIASHDRLAESHAEMREAVVRVEAKLDTLADLTPVRGIKRPTTHSSR